jgi:hypothetical protein
MMLGTVIMNTMRSTSTMSTSGVTLLVCAAAQLTEDGVGERVDAGHRRAHAAVEHVEGDDGGDGDEQAHRGGDERLEDACHDCVRRLAAPRLGCGEIV